MLARGIDINDDADESESERKKGRIYLVNLASRELTTLTLM
jgi:hypothetical protein